MVSKSYAFGVRKLCFWPLKPMLLGAKNIGFKP